MDNKQPKGRNDPVLDEPGSPNYERMRSMNLTDEQKAALRALGEAYENLSRVWPDEWNFEDPVGGEGLLPIRDLDEAAVELFTLIGDM